MIKSKTDKYICLFDGLVYDTDTEKDLIFDYFCISGKSGLICNDRPLTLNPTSIREANAEEIYILFSRVRAELLSKQIVAPFENDDAGQKEGKE